MAGRPGSSEVPRNPLTRWDVSSIPANGIFLTKKLKNKIKMPNGLLLLLFLTFSAFLVANPKKLLYTVANPARGLLNRKKKEEKKSLAAPPPPHPARCSFGEKKKKKNHATYPLSRRHASRRYAGGLGPSRIRTRIPTTRQLGQWVSLRKTLRFRVRLQLSQSRCLSLLLAMSGRVFLFLPPRDHEPPLTLRNRLNPTLSLYRHRFPIPRYAKRPDVALYTVGPFSPLPTPSSTHCALKVSEHDSLWQPPAAHSEERSRPQKSSRAQRCLNTLAPGYLKGTVVRGHPVVWSLALRSDDAKQDSVVYGTKFGVVFLAECPRTASIQKGFDCFGLYHPGLERECDFRLVVELP